MKIEKLNDINQLIKLKNSYENDFPSNERIPFFYLKRLVKKKILEVLFFKEKEIIIGYMITAKSKNKYILIEYFAIFEDYRSKGYGSICLKLCNEYYKNQKGIFLEVEKRGLGNDENQNVLRNRRISFYEKNGYKNANITAILYKTHFETLIYTNSNIINQQEIISAYKDIYSKLAGLIMSKINCQFKIE